MTRYSLQVPSIIGHTTLEKFFDDFWGDTQKAIERTTAGYPVTDIYKEDGNQIIEMALAGFSEEMIEINVEDNNITISSDGTQEQTKGSRIARRSFRRQFTDYDHKCDLENSSATFNNGLLRICIPPKESKTSKLIKIN